MYYRFERLDTWKMAREFVKTVYSIGRSFPKEEIYGLTSQIRRASVSVLLNIAEGSERGSDKEFARFMRIATSSIHEVVAGMYIALDQHYIDEQAFSVVYNASHELTKKCNALIRFLEQQKDN